MSSSDQPSVRESLRTLAGAKRSGELVAVTADAEFHVYLREGCIAWATDSREPALFSRTIKKECSIDDASFADVLNECRQSRLPLGETLVTLGMATGEQVRSALRYQAKKVIGALAQLHHCTHMFLERPGFLSYRHDFTFPLAELEASEPVEPPSESRVEVSKYFEQWSTGLMRAPGVDWVAVTDASSVVCHAGELATSTHGSAVRVATLMRNRGGRLLAFQARDGALIGVQVMNHTLLCHSSSSTAIGALASTVVSLGLFELASGRSFVEHPRRWKHQVDDPSLSRALEQVLELDPHLHAVSVQTNSHQPALGITSSAQHLTDLSTQNKPLFEALRAACGIKAVAASERLILATHTQTLFALQESDAQKGPVSVWVLAGPSCSFGVGLASLSTAVREVKPVVDQAPH